MAIDLRALPDSAKENLILSLRGVLEDLEDQLNGRAQIYTDTKGKIPQGLVQGDIAIIADQTGKIGIKVKNRRQFDTLTADMIEGLSKLGTYFKGFQVGLAALPTAPINFPNQYDWGFYQAPAGGNVYFCIHIGGNTLVKIQLT